MTNQGHHSYRQSAANVMISKDQILLKLYAGSLNFLTLARRGIIENSPKVRGENISRVLGILVELDSALDMKSGGEISENLSTLYRHMMYKLSDVNINNNLESLTEVELLLTEIKEGFEEAVKTQKNTTSGSTTRLGYLDNNEKSGFSYAV